MIIIETPRLYLRQFLPEDAGFFYELNNDPEVLKYTGDKPFKTIEDSLELIRNYDQYTKFGLGRLTVIRKKDNCLLGWCGLKYLEATGEIDLGYRFKKQFWNVGYATESGRKCLEFGFSKPHIHTIIARTGTQNHGSIKVLEKLGMKYVKDFDYDGIPSKYFVIKTLQTLDPGQKNIESFV